MKKLALLFLLLSAFSVYLDASKTSTLPSPLETQGYLYLTFCSTESEYTSFDITPQGFEASPKSFDVYFSGSLASPDCKQLVIFVKSNDPGMYNLIVKQGGNEWNIPVIFEKKEPILVSLSKNVLYTGYDRAKLYISGNGKDAWISINSSVVGSNVFHAASLPASFDLVFYFPSPGYYKVPVSVEYHIGNSTLEQVYTLGVRVEEPPIEIKSIARVPSQGYSNLTLSINSPEKLYSARISIDSKCLEGEKEKFFDVFENGNVSFKVKGICDPGIYSLTVKVGNYARSIPLEIFGPNGFEVMQSPSFEKGKATLEVTIANIGSDVMKSTSVKLLPGNYEILDEGSFLGDLEPGDFDSAELELIPKARKVKVNYQISFAREGRRIYVNKSYELVMPKSSNLSLLYLLLLVPVVYYARTRKNSGKISSS